ncbi:MAG: hypothetical protein QXF12_00280 [Candidatus Aenigmatarchaeota archaeon]
MNAHNKVENSNVHIMSRLMSLITFFVTIAIEIYVILVNSNFPYALEIIGANFIFILSLLGIRGWISTKMMHINTLNGNNNENNYSGNVSRPDSMTVQSQTEKNSDSYSVNESSTEVRMMIKKE